MHGRSIRVECNKKLSRGKVVKMEVEGKGRTRTYSISPCHYNARKNKILRGTIVSELHAFIVLVWSMRKSTMTSPKRVIVADPKREGPEVP